MSLQHVYGATVVVFVFGVVAVGPAYAQRRDGGLLPQEQEGQVTAVGCLLRGSAVRGGKKDKDKYVLARPRRGPVSSVPEATCTADPGADALDLDNTSKAGVNDSLLGRWVEISGKLEKETSKNPDDLRELDVAAFKLVPVVAPAPEAAPAPAAAAPARRQPRHRQPPNPLRQARHHQPLRPRRLRRQRVRRPLRAKRRRARGARGCSSAASAWSSSQ